MSRAHPVPAGASIHGWQDSVVSNLSSAEAAHKQALTQMVAGMLSVQSTNCEHGRQRDALHAHFTHKIQNTQELEKMLSTRMRSLRQTIQHTEWSLQQLKLASEALRELLERCQSRLEMRLSYPKREQVCDSFQEALLTEEKHLMVAKQKLGSAAGQTRQVLQELHARMQDLELDLRDKRQSHHLDNVCIDKKVRDMHTPSTLDKCYSKCGTPRRQALTELANPRSSHGWCCDGDDHLERERQRQTVSNVEQALRTEERARARWAESNDLLEASQRAIKHAQQVTEAQMAAKVEHTEVLREELLKKYKATNTKIRELQKYVDITTEKMQALNKPLTANKQRMRIRECRASREDITDQVSRALVEQMQSLKGKQTQLEAQAEAMMQALMQLEAARSALRDDISDKERAIAVERGCAALRKEARAMHSFGFAKVGRGQRQFAETASSLMRQVDRSPPSTRCQTAR